MNQKKSFGVDSMLDAGQISSDEARAGRRDIRNELDYFSELIDFA